MRKKQIKEENILAENKEDLEENKTELKETENSTKDGIFYYETNGIKYKKVFKNGVIAERVKI